MKFSFQGKNNAKIVSDIEKATGGFFTNEELFKGKKDGHKFNIGQKIELFGLKDYPEFNGEVITITAIRQDGCYGKAYYFKSNNPLIATQLNWTYEYRLREIKE